MNYRLEKMSPIQLLHYHLVDLRAARVTNRERIAVLEEQLRSAREMDLQNAKREFELTAAIHDLAVAIEIKAKEDFQNANPR